MADASTLAGTRNSIATRSRRRDLLELSVGYALILLVIWTPRPWQRLPFLAAIVWIILATSISFEGWKAMGLRISAPLRSLWIVGVALLLAALSVAIAARLHTLHPPGGPILFLKHYAGYAIWAVLQQFLLQDFFLLRLLRLLPTRNAAVTAATGLFTLAHLPNPILTPVTLIWGLAACLLFLRYRNLYPLALAHAIFGICLAITVPGPVDHNMRVGLGYLTYRPRALHHLSQNDHIVSTSACVVADAPTRRS
jgi:membrane protease YdiL (CAAX protease family)